MPTRRSDIYAILRRAGMLDLDAAPAMEALTGGVSSDIWRIDLDPEPVCVKRALAKLKVEADWRVPTERNAYEAAWIATARAAVPSAAPALLGRDLAADALVMRFLEPGAYRLWKTQLRDGQAVPVEAAAVGEVLVRIHAATAQRDDVAAAFPTDRIFHDVRLEPYLLATALRHGDLARVLRRLARRTAATKLVLVHGDVSPKNILLGPDGPVLLDSECAWYGDPAFDLAFCLNHLLLKCLWTPAAAEGFLACFDALAETYLAGVVWEPRAAVEARAASLLPALLLARVDGKSPVEYLTAEAQRELVRRFARRHLRPTLPEQLAPIRRDWAEDIAA